MALQHFSFYFVIMYAPIELENVISFITAYKVHPKKNKHKEYY
jgi:hypothetical protein